MFMLEKACIAMGMLVKAQKEKKESCRESLCLLRQYLSHPERNSSGDANVKAIQ